MERLNYFNPYESKEAQHEDQLTRAYLVLLKHSSHAFFVFFEYCRDKLILGNQEQHFSLLEFIENDWIIDTQRSNPKIETDYLLSVLITDENIQNDTSVSSSDRNARYDGIITFGNKLTMIIENKPASTNVWFDQLKPSKQNLSEDIIIHKNPVVLEWKEILKHLNSLQSISTISGYEKIMINDFLTFVDENFTFLNPYDNFSLCKNEEILLNRRIENILKSIVCDSIAVDYHRGWGFYINTQFDQIKKIGLILWKDENDWGLELSLNFGDSQNQARCFYNSIPDVTKIKKLKDWELYNNFHVSFQSTNLVWFDSNVDIGKYIEYWIENKDMIFQRKRDDVEGFINLLKKNNIIIYDINTRKEMENKYFNTAMQTLNICPGFCMHFNISSKEAIEKDKAGELENIISDKIKEGLTIANLDWKMILKQT